MTLMEATVLSVLYCFTHHQVTAKNGDGVLLVDTDVMSDLFMLYLLNFIDNHK